MFLIFDAVIDNGFENIEISFYEVGFLFSDRRILVFIFLEFDKLYEDAQIFDEEMHLVDGFVFLEDSFESVETKLRFDIEYFHKHFFRVDSYFMFVGV